MIAFALLRCELFVWREAKWGAITGTCIDFGGRSEELISAVVDFA